MWSARWLRPAPKFNGFFHGPCSTSSPSFMKIGPELFFHNPADSQTNQTKNMTSLVEGNKRIIPDWSGWFLYGKKNGDRSQY